MAAVAGLRASYHRLLDRIELKLPPRLRPLYNHPAGGSSMPKLCGICTTASLLTTSHCMETRAPARDFVNCTCTTAWTFSYL